MGQQLHDFFPQSKSVAPVGVTPGFIFSKDGSCGVGTYLRIGSVVTSDAGHPIIGKNRLITIRISAQSNVGSNTTVQIQKRTARTTRTDIAGASITIPSGNYTASVTFDPPIVLPDNVELCAYNKSGSTLSNAVMNVFLYPDYT
jgi:hypothetical protein